ncbi:alpha/beta hydrolase [Simiduia curdlanivorans]|uniref:Alpha/beta hydrolase n=1 Tax=Simiduia curdlanivorans TaxID=1492769 RepID=A0ABV8V3J6_9GAMM|nr:alpha/beta hydrolase [Simiduia curdlanivorans]MDN3640037.1 alpha/beta hydrolase [Simiduia curdlanivorans]
MTVLINPDVSAANVPVVERVFTLAGGREICAQVWERPDAPIFLALHGWLDNSASFSRLAPLLNVTVIALDLAGHGLSYHRNAEAPYHIWDDLIDLEEIVEQLGGVEVGLLGHSRGAIICAMYAAIMPERCHQVLLIDGLVPEPVPSAKFPAQLRKAILEFKRHAARSFPIYDSIAAAAKIRHQGMFPLSEMAANAIVERGTKPVDAGVTWRVDPKLLAPSMIKLTSEQINALVADIQVPATLVLASEGMPKLFPFFAKNLQSFSNIEMVNLVGSHHLHLEDEVVQVAALFNQKIQQHQGDENRV